MKKNNIENEYYIEMDILTRLNTVQGAYFWKCEYPSLFIPNQIQRFRKQKHPYIPNGIADIVGVFRGRMVAFEVKKVAEWKYVVKHYETLKNQLYSKNKKHKHLAEQIRFVENIIAGGGKAGFVCNYEQCVRILNA